jgi:hypothetical protein
MQMFKNGVYEYVAIKKVCHGVLFDKAGRNCFLLLRSAASFRFLGHWRCLAGYKRPPKSEPFYSEVEVSE